MLNPNAPHPGQVIVERYLKPLRMTATGLAIELRVNPNRMTEIVAGRRHVTVDTALRLARYFGGRPEDWMAMQAEWEIAQARKTGVEARIIEDIRPRSSKEMAA